MPSYDGTHIWCPNCEEVRKCCVVENDRAEEYAGDYHRLWGREDHPDIQWFQRVRECMTCGELFTTVEIHKDLLDELIRLRSSL